MRNSLCLFLALALSGCTVWPKRWGQQPCCFSTKPSVKKQTIAWHLVDVTVFWPVTQSLNPFQIGRWILRRPVHALNLKDGQVFDSAFFTNQDPASLSSEQMRWGPTQLGDSAQGPFLITRMKREGKTSGFFVTDAAGKRYLFKLDPIDAPELLSGAEVVTSKLLHALGYRVPSYEIVILEPKDLKVSAESVQRDNYGRAHPVTLEDVTRQIRPRLRQGRLRVVASRIVDGQILGPARFKDFRNCAEMRALKVAYAWLNNIDAKDHNTLLVWDGKQTLGYLIDFGTSLGADAGRAGLKHPCAGSTYIVDPVVGVFEMLTLGMFPSGCEAHPQSLGPSLGILSPEVDPDRWKPYAPNVAFQAMTREDALWMTRRLGHLSKAQIEAVVSAAQYIRTEDATLLVEVIEARRASILKHYGSGRDDGVL